MEAAGPFRADQIRDGDPYELDRGHPIEVMPTRRRGGRIQGRINAIIGSDPAVKQSGVEVGYSVAPDSLRAPDISVLPDTPDPEGWDPQAPPLAIEVADRGQDEADLVRKVETLLAAGTRYFWVVRVHSRRRRVDVFEAGQPKREYFDGDELTAPGVLALPVPVTALFEANHGNDVVLRNLLSREGYASIEAVQDEGRQEGRQEGRTEALLLVLRARGLSMGDDDIARIRSSTDAAQVERWLARAVVATTLAEVLSDGS